MRIPWQVICPVEWRRFNLEEEMMIVMEDRLVKVYPVLEVHGNPSLEFGLVSWAKVEI